MSTKENTARQTRRSRLRPALPADTRDSAAFLIVALVVFVICITGVFNPSGILSLILYPTPSSRHDRWTASDLGKIATAAAQYPDQGSDLTLSTLDIKGLHYPSTSYAFEWNPGAGGTPATYTLCATFDRATISKTTNMNQVYENQDDSVYGVHHKGLQCYDTNLGPYTSGTRLDS